MNKGINTAIEETKAELIELINSKLSMGVPVSVMGIIIDNVSNQIKLHTMNAIKMESENAQKEEAQNNGSDSEKEE
jgi:hypothetical protein